MNQYLSYILLATLIIGCAKPEKTHLDSSSPIDERVDLLLEQMTLEEKVGQMTQYVGLKYAQGASNVAQLDDVEANPKKEFYPGLDNQALKEKVRKGEIGSFLLVKGADEANYLQKLAQETRLKIPVLIGEDAIHGHAIYDGATVFPTPIGLSCSFDTAMIRQIAQITAREMRQTGYHWTFSPNVDVAREARWGRTGETFGEDPLLVGAMGLAMTLGYQENLSSTGVLACAKHYAAGSQPVRGINFSPMDASERAIREIWLPPYEPSIDAGCRTVMAAHHDLNGMPCHANSFLLTEVLREEWDFGGFVVSDWMDVSRLHTVHKIAPTMDDANRLAVSAGLDMNMHGPGFFESVVEQVKAGKITQERIDAAARAILKTKFELGLFENPFVDESQIDLLNDEAKALALESAKKSLVLLENKNNILPLASGQFKKIFVTGPNANNNTILGDWSASQPDSLVTTVLEGLQQNLEGSAVDYYACGDHRNITDQDVKETRKRASRADLSIIVVGDNALRNFWNERTNGENAPRADVSLFGRQLELVKAAYETGKPVVVVLVVGKPTAIPWIKENIPGVLLAWEPGLAGGTAIAEALTGKFSPSGKLSISIPRSSGQLPVFYNHYPATYYRKYVDEPTGPLYEFGYGLGYNEITYRDLKMDSVLAWNKPVSLSVNIQNKGTYATEESVLLFMRDDYSSVATPVRSLVAFQKVALQPGESKTVTLSVPFKSLSLLDVDLKRVVEAGTFTFMIEELSQTTRLPEK